MNGILCMNKPQDFTSFDVIAKLRGILKIKRLGHAGTLDPMATGVLPVFVGSATKACDIIPDTAKSYTAGFRLGCISDTQDSSGSLSEISDMNVTAQMLLHTLPLFTGDIMQLPPMFSAVQVNGQRLYDLARKGIEVEREKRQITINSLSLAQYDENSRSGLLNINCSKGTYVRTIIHDIGQNLGCGAVMTSLVRTSSCGFSLDCCHTFAEVENARDNGCLEQLIIPVESVFSSLPKLKLSQVQTKMYRNGVKLDLSRVYNILSDCDTYAVYGFDEKFIGTAVADHQKNELRIGKNLAL
ncbi:MAG: tRNA pseudouridine(55) synthase TruB [Ruminococcus sp.]|nr:tRNA pseudouridine(55) synthase TruB [Ruminococcus sp.]